MDIRQLILEAPDLPREPITVPEWGGATFFLRTLSEEERENYLLTNTHQKGRKKGQLRKGVAGRLVVLCAVDENGRPIFQAGDVDKLSQKSGAVLSRVFDACRRLNGIGDDFEEEEDPLKNSATAPASASPTA